MIKSFILLKYIEGYAMLWYKRKTSCGSRKYPFILKQVIVIRSSFISCI